MYKACMTIDSRRTKASGGEWIFAASNTHTLV